MVKNTSKSGLGHTQSRILSNNRNDPEAISSRQQKTRPCERDVTPQVKRQVGVLPAA